MHLGKRRNNRPRLDPSETRGFTLIELLIVVVLLAVISVVSSDIFISIARSNNKSNIINEIQQNGNFVLQTIAASLRNARSVSPASGTSFSLEIQDKDNFYIAYQMANIGLITVIQRCQDRLTSCSGKWETVTNANTRSGVNVVTDSAVPTNGSYFKVVSNPGSPSVVSIVLKMSQSPDAVGRIDFQTTTTLETSVSLRNY